MTATLRWGILGTGNIAGQFCAGMKNARHGVLAAVGSRSESSARALAKRHRITVAHGSYEALIADGGIDAVYIALPNSLHCQWTIEALRAGKHVLCEKPLAMSAAEAERMFDESRKAGRVLMEAFMYRCHPATAAVLQAVGGGAIGRLHLVRTSFCFRTRRIDGNVRFVRQLGGGALMDVGCYCINFARLIAGSEPQSISAAAQMHASGVDELVAATLAFPSGVISQFTCSLGVQADNTAYLCGDEGFIEIPMPWKPRPRAKFIVAQGIPPKMDGGKSGRSAPRREIHWVDAQAELYAVEADDFANSVRSGWPARVSREDSLGNMRVLDEIRRQIGLNFE
ncbi:MAG: Gfo/Idh/MocA family oxidoreductase [Tepidisphaeraceae bacterium]|jgi:predicted dehydrogenase